MLVYAYDRGRTARSLLGRDTEWAAPEHWKAEVFSVIRGLALGNKIKEERAVWAIERLPHLGIDHVSLDDLLPRMWQFRANISGYDAPYLAPAEPPNLTLGTFNSRLAPSAP